MPKLQSQTSRSFPPARSFHRRLQAALGALLVGALVAPPLAASAAGAVGATDGAPPSKPAATRTTKLGHCSTEAKKKGLKGDERKKFISECIKSS